MIRCSTTIGLAAALLLPSIAQAQITGSDDANVVVEVVSFANVAATEHLDFGQLIPGSRASSSQIPTRAGWNVALAGTQQVQVDFVLPSTLSDGAGHSIPVTFEPTSGRIQVLGLTVDVFDPVAGITFTPTESTFFVFLGEDGTGTGNGDVELDLTGAAPAVYSGVITMTVTIL